MSYPSASSWAFKPAATSFSSSAIKTRYVGFIETQLLSIVYKIGREQLISKEENSRVSRLSP